MNEAEIRAIFSALERGDGDGFFAHVADGVRWNVMGTHPLAGEYRSKSDFRTRTFDRLAPLVRGKLQLQVTAVLAAGNWATVELRADAVAKSGMRFDNRYCWVCRFEGGTIVEVRAYLDSVLVQRLVDENETS